MQEPLVSVLMTSFNREKYIAEAIESVLASTYQNFELIIVDDRSRDNTVKIAMSYAEKDKRVKVYINEINLGDYPNRNKAASYAQGKYLKYVDADDLIYPWGLELLVEMMESFPDAGFGLCSLDQNNDRPFPILLTPKEAYTYNYIGPGLFNKAPLSAIIKREVFEKEKGFDAIRMAGDFEMWHRLAKKYPVVAMPHGIVWYRKHAEQEMSSYRKYIQVYEKLKFQFLKDINCPLNKEEIKTVVINSRKKALKEILKGIILLDMPRIKDNYLRYSIAGTND